MNQRYCVLNDRDNDLWVDVEARIRCLLFTMMKPDTWKGYETPGYATMVRYFGNDYYDLFKCALGQFKVGMHIEYPPDNIPTQLSAAEYAELNGCRLLESTPAVYCAQHPCLQAGTELSMFGGYKINKFNTVAQTAPLHTVELHAKTGKTNKPLYIRLAKNCPWRFVRCVTDAQHSNCKLLENMTVSFWEHTRAVMQLTRDVPDGEELVCLTPAQGIARLTVATRLRLPRQQQRSESDVEEGEGDDPASDDDDVVFLPQQAPSPEVVAIKTKAAAAARADRANKRKSDPSEQGKGEADAPTKKPKRKPAPRKQYTRLKSRNQTSDEDEAEEEAEEEAEDEETN